jgi:transaldolase
MSIFLDTSNIDEINFFHEMGIIRGVTTNPSIMFKEGINGGMAGIKEASVAIANLISPLPLSVEVTSNDFNDIISQSIEFSSWAKNINVKITIHGPNGELENLVAVNKLEKDKNIRVNVTAMMSVQQCYLAAMAGASFVSIFGGRVNNMGYSSNEEIRKLRQLIDSFSLNAKIIVGSTREALNVTEWLLSGAHIVTCTPEFLKTMIVHPYSKETIKMFLDDAKKL